MMTYDVINLCADRPHHQIKYRYAYGTDDTVYVPCNINSTETTESINSFVEFYTADVNNELFNEWIQWRSFLKQLPSTETGTAVTPQKMLNIMYRYNLKDGFPNVCIALRIYLTLPVSNCSGERSFSHLKRIKSSLRSTMGQDRLANLTLLNIESEILTDLDFQDIIDSFSTLKARRKDF